MLILLNNTTFYKARYNVFTIRQHTTLDQFRDIIRNLNNVIALRFEIRLSSTDYTSDQMLRLLRHESSLNQSKVFLIETTSNLDFIFLLQNCSDFIIGPNQVSIADAPPEFETPSSIPEETRSVYRRISV